MLIRPSTLADKAAIGEMAFACYSTLLTAHYSHEVLTLALPHMSHVPDDLAQCGTYFVATERAQIVGACGWTDGLRGAEVRKLAVHPDHLRKGIARRLLAHVHGSASAAGHSHISTTSSLNAVPFYAALGYADVGQTSIDTGHANAPFDAVAMMRDL